MFLVSHAFQQKVPSWLTSFLYFLSLSLSGADSLAQKVYSDILSYRSKAETIRNALAVLQRYRFLFNLPKSIEKNISNVSPFGTPSGASYLKVHYCSVARVIMNMLLMTTREPSSCLQGLKSTSSSEV